MKCIQSTLPMVFLLLLGSFLGCPEEETPGECGDQTTDEGEECDDGNDDDTDACTSACKNASCGDGLVRVDLNAGDDGYEACDDGNDDSTDDCTSACAAPACGDGFIQEGAGEVCDDGNTVDEDGCPSDCSVIDFGFECTVNMHGGSDCFSVCGDGKRSSSEPVSYTHLTLPTKA